MWREKMEKIDAAQWEVFRESNALKITPTEQRLIAKLHSKYFKHKYADIQYLISLSPLLEFIVC